MHGSPWAFSVEPVTWAVVLALGVAYFAAVRRPGWGTTKRQVALFVTGLVLLLLSCSWPLAGIAAHWSLTALVLQRLLLTLAVPPLMILGTPQPIVAALTRPAPIDGVLRRCARPAVAVIVVTFLAVSTLTVGAVDWQASSTAGRAFLDLVLICAGVVLWTPVLHQIPGMERPSAIGRAGYLVIQSIIPSFLAVVWIFARHPMYSAYAHTRLFGLSPLTDQQLAGFVAKLGTIAVLWTVAFFILSRAQTAADQGDETEPLTWADVERQLERIDRSKRKADGPNRTGRPPV